MLTIKYANIRSIKSKYKREILHNFIDGNINTIYLLTESWLDEQIPDSCLSSDHQIFRCDRPDSTGGGVICFLPKHIQGNQISELTFSMGSGFECCTIVITIEKTKYLISVCYRSPSFNDFSVLKDFFNKVSKYKIPENRKIITGDFNFPDINWHDLTASNKLSKQFLNLASSLGLYQIIKFPTLKENILDLMFTSQPDLIDKCEASEPFGYPEKPSDHKSISAFISIHIPNIPITQSLIPDYINTNWTTIKFFLSDINWETYFNDCENVDSMWNKFKELCNFIISNMIAKRFTHTKPKLTRLISKLRRFKFIEHRLIQSYKASPSKYKLLKRKQVSRELRLTRKEMALIEENNILLHPNNKKFFSYVNRKTNPSQKIPTIQSVSGTDLIKDDEKAVALNNYFNSIYAKSSGKFDELEIENTDINTNIAHKINCLQVIKYIRNLPNKTSTGHDNISYVFLKKLAEYISIPLSKIYRVSLLTSKCPEDWKHSIIVPAEKMPKLTIISNHRPISVTCTPCRLFEKMLRDELETFCIANKIFSEFQFGFVPKKSAEMQVLSCVNDYTTYLDEGTEVHIFYADINKAFDSVNHILLLNKLKELKIPTHLVLWIKSFLDNRTHSVKINNYISNKLVTHSGVPQGAVLSPTLFALFINNIPNSVYSSKIKLFADDIKLYKQIKTHNDAKLFQNDINSLSNWLVENNLSLSIGKCAIQKLGKTKIHHENYKLNNIIIPTVSIYKDLGIDIDSKLNFNQHILQKSKKGYCKVGCLRNNFHTNTPEFYSKIIKSYIRSTVEYGSSIWNTEKMGQIKLIEKPQRRCTKLIKNFYNLSYSERLQHIELDSILFRNTVHDLILGFKIVKGFYSDISPSSFFIFNNDTRTRRCNRYKLQKQISHTNIRKTFWSQRILYLWNKIPDNYFDAKSPAEFKKYLINNFRQSIIEYLKPKISSIS